MKDTLKYDLETDFDLEFNDLIITEESNDISSTLKKFCYWQNCNKGWYRQTKITRCDRCLCNRIE